MIGLSLPEIGQPFGWSVCSSELAKALGAITETWDASESPTWRVADVPILHAVQGPNMLPIRPLLGSDVRNVGYCFIEEPLLAARSTLTAATHFSALVTGSTWCTKALDEAFQRAGLHIPITTAIQGISPRFFEVQPREEDGRFIVFSGGKAEYRKSQDVVIKAMKVFMDRHKDAWLNYSWHNPWNVSIPGYLEVLQAARELDQRRVIGPRFAARAHTDMPAIYRQADIGLFPNRAEAGNNMVMCEFMACGKPVIASYETGHRDVLPSSWLDLIESTPLLVNGPDGRQNALWVEPSIEEILDRLENAYKHRDELPAIGVMCREHMRQFTWERCALELLKVLEEK